MRLNKYLSQAGICSRRRADEYIKAGEVCVNGTTASVGMQIDPENDWVVSQGKVVSLGCKELVHYALYKPVGVISTTSDEKGRTTVTDLVPSEPRVYPVGRLDKDSEGLIILTNDGDLTYELTHPKFKHPKEYEVEVKATYDGLAPEAIKELFAEGVPIEDKLFKADLVHCKDNDSKDNVPEPTPLKDMTLYLILHTGYKRQIRRMCEAVGLSIVALKRVRIGRLRLELLGLAPGEYCRIEKSDICD